MHAYGDGNQSSFGRFRYYYVNYRTNLNTSDSRLHHTMMLCYFKRNVFASELGSEKIALVYIAYKTLLMLLTKESDLSLVLSLVKLMHCLNTIVCMYLSLAYCTEQNDILSIKLFIYSVLLFHLRTIFTEPGSLLFTTWQAIPFKRKFYILLE